MRRYANRLISPAALLVVAVITAGCTTAPRAVFPYTGPPIVWPAAPDPPRIRYIGELVGEANVGRHVSGGQALRELVAGAPPLSGFVTPLAVAVERERVFVADPGHPSGPLVHVVDLAQRRYTTIRTAGDKPLAWPIDVAVRQGDLAVADAKLGAVLLFDSEGHLRTTIGAGALKRPASVSWDREGRLWVVDSAAAQIVAFTPEGRETARFGRRGAGPTEFNFPSGLATADSGLWLADAMNFRVQHLSAAGAPLSVFGQKGDAAGCFSLPRDVALDSDGHVYALDNQFENFQIFDERGALLLAVGAEGNAPGQFNLPSGITIDEHDRIWIADTYNRRVQVFQFIRQEATP